MITKKNYAKLVLMSILAAVTTMSMTACSSDDDLMQDNYSVKDQSNSRQDAPIGRTVLVYMAGKNDLSYNPNNPNVNYLNMNLEEIKEGSRQLKNEDCLLVFVRRFLKDNSLETPWLARISRGKVVDSVSVADMGVMRDDSRASDPEVMEQVMHYAFSHYPATRDYGLILWSHSTGWMMEEEVIARTRGFGMDTGNYIHGRAKWINIPTLKNILEKMPHLKFIMADCCHFMCLESLYELRNVADYAIGSPAEIPGRGAPYKDIVPSLFESETFYSSTVDKYYASTNGKLPLSVVKMSEMGHVAQATGSALQSVKDNLGGDYADLNGLIHYGHLGNNMIFHAENNFFFDAGDFLSRYASKADYQLWKQACDRAVVMKRMGNKWDTYLRWRDFYVDFEMTEERFHGVSMFIPQDPAKGNYDKCNEDIKQMEWYNAVKL